MMSSLRAHRIGAWLGPIGINLFGLPLIWPARLFPLPSATFGAGEIASIFHAHRVGISIAAIGLLYCVAFLGGNYGTISAQMRWMRGERESAVYSNAQLAGGLLSLIPLVIVSIIWMTQGFRDRPDDITWMLGDLSFLMFVVVAPPASVQNCAIGLAILEDDQADPVYPRWVAYLNFWVAALFLPGSMACFFHSGPFAWNGLLVWYVPLTAAAAWYFVMCWAMLRAAKRRLA